MSHFYNRRSYTFAETDQMLGEMRKECSNFITREEAELILYKRTVIIDPNPWHKCNCESYFYKINRDIDLLNDQLEKYKTLLDKYTNNLKDKDFDEPTM